MLRPRQRRLLQRLRQHHLPLFTVSAITVFLLYVTRPYPDVVTRLSFATAYPALVLLAFTLLIGPFNLLQQRRMPVSSDWRRDIGIWAGILGFVHTVIGQNVHLRGRPWLYYIYEDWRKHITPLRHDLFGFANYTGLISAIILLLLLATSNDYALRALGTPRWKRLQRWNYFAFALAGAHAVAYQVNEKQTISFIVVVVLSIAVTIVLQVVGYQIRRTARRKRVNQEISH
jgi:methionine sulfoxide reductase heme-binding subunit